MKKRLVCLALVLVLSMPLFHPAFALTDLNIYATSSFSKGYDVYSGPGTYYFRNGDYQAYYSRGAVRIYGVCGDWVMIGYGFTKNGVESYRIGYVSKDCLNYTNYVNGAINYRLTFNGVTAYTDNNCYITDDPVITGKSFYKIPEGSAVTALGSLGNWTYIEARLEGVYVRGFVRSFTLSYSGATPTIEPYTPTTATPAPATPVPTATPYTPPTATPYTPPTATPYYPPYTPPTATPYYPPYTPPTATPYYPPYTPPTATPAANVPNTYYHDYARGSWLPGYQWASVIGVCPVYSGPGTYYFRAAGGRAQIGGGSCRIFGVENGWALIGYTLSNGNYRLGYIDQAYLTQMGMSIPYLDLSYTTRQLRYAASLTDDIFLNKTPVVTLPAGTYVLFLDYVYESGATWAYVEVLINNTIMRGFIPVSAL